MAENLWAISIDPDEAMREYVLLQLKVRAMRDLLFRSKIFNYLAAATPGLRELVTIGKIWELALDERKVKKGRNYDLVIVDAPATGHGVGFLQTPRTFANVARVGPIALTGRDARRVPHRPPADRRRDRRAAGGDAGQRDGRPGAATWSTRSASRSTASTERPLPRALQPTRRSGGWSGLDEAEDGAAPRASRRAARERRRAVAQREQLARLEDADRGAGGDAAVHLRARAGPGAAARARGGGRLMASRRRAARGQARLHLRGLGRRRQDDDLGGDRRGHGGARQEGRRAHDRPGEAPRRLARPAGAGQRPSARSIPRCSPRPASTPRAASSGR